MKYFNRLLLRTFLTFSIGGGFSLYAQSDVPSDVTELEWPQEIIAPAGKIILYQPQLESFTGNELQARAAVSVTPQDSVSPIFGAMWFSSRVSTDRDKRTVTLEDVTVTASKFPDMDEKNVDKLSRLLESEIPKWEIVMSLDRLLTSLELVEREQELSENLNNDPPEIIFTTKPSVLVVIDGDPILHDIEKSDLKYIINTPFLIVYEPSSKLYYLRGGANWYVSKSVLKNWETTIQVPKGIAELAKESEEQVQAASEDLPPDTTQGGEPVIPQIIVRTEPTELIQSAGEPEYTPIEGTELLFMKNTESDVIINIQTQEYFLLISGRWYKAKSLTDNKWTFIPPDQVPAEFANIPAESDMGNVRASVAGTQEAREAVLENSIPQTAVVDRKEATLTVEYDGDPEFKQIEGTGMSYAVNTGKSVLLIEGRYYCCDEAIWFESDNPKGPWQVCVKIPDQVQEIPPESPVYNVKYVYIYDSTPEVVYVSYTPGYYGSYVYGGCVVYGTGWWYHPWYRHYYYPRPVTWGFGVHYNPWTGWGFSFGVSYGWLHIGFGSWRSPYYGWWGPAPYRYGYRHGYHRGYSRGYYAGTRAGYRAGYRAAQNSPNRNIYKNRSKGVRETPTRKPQTRIAQQGGRGTPAQMNNVYTDRNGDIYKRDDDGWQKRENGTWQKTDQTDRGTVTQRPQPGEPPKRGGEAAAKPANRPQTKPDAGKSRVQSGTAGSQGKSQSLNRDYQSRQRGNQRAQQFQSSRSPGSGGSRGGGRRR